ncbi:MAG: glycosyltransferase family 4 protein [Pseudomonadota bacterium]|nr:glycosyltransferase family 4 protein [Pseudomonadota bacterium]
MRIAVMLRTLEEKGGIGVYSRNLIETLLDVDAINDYLLLFRDPAQLGRYAGNPRVTEHLLQAHGKAWWDQVSVPRACRELDADLILHPKFTVPLLTGIPTVMVLHGADWFLPDAAQFYGRLDRAYMRVFMPLYLRRAAVAISVSQLTTDDFRRIFRLPEGKVRTVYFGPARHFRRVTDPQAIAAVRQKYGLPERYLLTLSKVGGAGRKNIRGIFDAFASLHGRIPHKLVIGGKDCERFREDYELPADGWGKNVVFPGWIDQADLPAVYSASELYLYPSMQEAFPIPLTEAMTCGTPIITSRANGLEEIAGSAALLVNPQDPAAIAAAIQRVIGDAALRARLVNVGLERSQLFSWDSCARKTLAILEEAAGKPGRHGMPQQGRA